jgi:hypothetical protein
VKSASIELRYDRDALSPIHEGICLSPALERELILGGQAVDGVETITSFVDGDPTAYEPLVADNERVQEYEITPTEDGFFLYLRQELGPEGQSLLNALAQDTVVVVPPIAVRSDRTMRLTLVGHPDDLGTILETAPGGVAMNVLWARDELTVSGDDVSERQREALEVARKLGYYEIPRRNGIEAVAAEIECAASTVSELLRRGEARAVAGVLDGGP